MRITLIKAQTNGNDFLIIPNTVLNNKQIRQICDRHYGIGCDQLIMFNRINYNIFCLEFYNNDGSLANMCGNGSCAFALFVNKYIDKNLHTIYIQVSKLIGKNSHALYNINSNNSVNKSERSGNTTSCNTFNNINDFINNSMDNCFSEVCTNNNQFNNEYENNFKVNTNNENKSNKTSQQSINNRYKLIINNNKVNISFPMPYYVNNDIICTGNYHKVYCIEALKDLQNIQKQYPECNIHFIKEINNIDEINTEIKNKMIDYTSDFILNTCDNESNFNYVKEHKHNNIVKVITYERGAGRTLACGSGAIAIAFYLKNRISINDTKHYVSNKCKENRKHNTSEFVPNICDNNIKICSGNSITLIQEGGISEVVLQKNHIELTTKPQITAECYIHITNNHSI